MSSTLILVSLSAARQEALNYDFVFPLDAAQLPKFSLTEIWKKSMSNPLRDRIMIEWLFSYTAVKGQLDTMVAKINEEIQRRLPANNPQNETLFSIQHSPVTQETSTKELAELSPSRNPPILGEGFELLVLVSCSNGHHYSPCFVEKLREIYENDKTLKKQLFIKTEHRDLLRTTKKDFVWYHSKIPSFYVQHVEMLTNNRLWLPFDEKMNYHLEQTFQEDPYCSSIVPNATDVVDFACGSLYNKQKRKSFYIRSTVLKAKERRSAVKCRLVGDVAYRAVVKGYDAAGILFYSVHPQTGEALFLLGQLTYNGLTWCDFGGLKHFKKVFNEPARHTAARECYEETLGVLGSTKTLVSMLEDYKTNNVFKVVNEVYNYVEHFLRIPFLDYQRKFEEAVKCHPQLEVDKIRWFPITAMRRAVELGLSNRRVIVNCLEEYGEPSCELRVEFVHTLCIAEKLGILHSIDYITKQLHASSLAPHPRPVSYPKPRPTLSEQQVNTNTPSQEHTTATSTPSQEHTTATSTPSQEHTTATSTPSQEPTSTCTVTTCEPDDTKIASVLKFPISAEWEVLHSESSHLSDHSSPSSSIAASDTPNTEISDLVCRSRAWSFEEFMAGLNPEGLAAGGGEEGKRSPLLTRQKHKKQTKEAKKEKTSVPTPVENGKQVIFYGMGAGTFGI